MVLAVAVGRMGALGPTFGGALDVRSEVALRKGAADPSVDDRGERLGFSARTSGLALRWDHGRVQTAPDCPRSMNGHRRFDYW